MPKAYSLLRFSEPAYRPGPSRRLGTAVAELYARRRKLELDASLHAIDTLRSAPLGRSATELVLGEFLERVQAGEVAKGSFLLIETLDRMSSGAASASGALLQRIAGAGVTIVTLADAKEHTRATLADDPMSLLYAVAGFMRAHDERAIKSRRTRASWKGRRERARKKEPISAMCPAWLVLDRDAAKFRVDPERARVVRRIFRDVLRGVGVTEIADALNEEGVAVFGRGREWHRSYILKLLRSPAVLGTYAPHTLEHVQGRRVRKPAGPGIRDYYPVVVEAEVFWQAQTLTRASRSPLRGRHAKAGKVVNVFGGLAYCGRCGASVTMVSKGKRPKATKYLVCSAARVRAGCRRYEAIRYERFEEALFRERDSLFAGTLSREPRVDFDRLITEAEASAYGVADALEKLSSRSASGRHGATTTERIRKLESDHEKLRLLAESLRVERETTSGTSVRGRVAKLREALAAKPLDRTRVNALMRQVFSGVIVDYEGHDLAFQWRHGGQSEVELGS